MNGLVIILKNNFKLKPKISINLLISMSLLKMTSQVLLNLNLMQVLIMLVDKRKKSHSKKITKTLIID